MTEIPTWWLVLSGVFFVCNGVLFIVGTIALIYLIRVLKVASPRLAAIEKSIQELVVKISAVTEKVEQVATSLRETVENVGGRAKGVAGSAELVAATASRQFEKASPIVTGVLTALKIMQAVQGFRASRSAKKESSKKKSGLAVFKK